MRLDVYFHNTDESEVKRLLNKILHNQTVIMTDLTTLTAAVEANGTVIGSAIILLQGLKAALDAAGTDPVALKALSDSLAAKDTELADAIAANTPSA